MRRIFGLSRSRDKKGKVVKRNVNPYVNCIHASVGGGWKDMWVLAVEYYETGEGDRQGEDKGRT